MMLVTDKIVRVILPNQLDCLFEINEKEKKLNLLSYTKVDNKSSEPNEK